MAKKRSPITRRAESPTSESPIVVMLAGPNGAGKSTAAPRLLRGTLGVVEFLNADLIARGLSPFDPERAALAASEVMLQRMDKLARQRISFGLESTLAARTLAPRMQDLLKLGYEFHLVFLWLPSADMAVARVESRVQMGGHDVPEETIRRRYRAGLHNFFELYFSIATTWRMYDNSEAGKMRLIATGSGLTTTRVPDKKLWHSIRQEYSR